MKLISFFGLIALIFSLLALVPNLEAIGKSAEIVVNKDLINNNRTRSSMSVNELVDIFTKRKLNWSDRTEIVLVTYKEDSIPAKVFIQDVLGLTPYQYRARVDRNVYKGKSPPVIEVQSEEEMIDVILKNDKAIGYLFNYILVKNDERLVIISVEP